MASFQPSTSSPLRASLKGVQWRHKVGIGSRKGPRDVRKIRRSSCTMLAARYPQPSIYMFRRANLGRLQTACASLCGSRRTTNYSHVAFALNGMQLTLPACEPLTRMLPGAPLGPPASRLHVPWAPYNYHHVFRLPQVTPSSPTCTTILGT